MSEIRVTAWLSSGEGPFPGVGVLTSYCTFTWWTAESGRCSGDSYKGTDPVHGGLSLMTSRNPNRLPKAPPPNTVTLGLQHMNLAGRMKAFSL